MFFDPVSLQPEIDTAAERRRIAKASFWQFISLLNFAECDVAKQLLSGL